jgi:hypothetical protein
LSLCDDCGCYFAELLIFGKINHVMGRKILFPALVLFLLAPLNAEAQKHTRLRFVGFDAGLNMAGIRSASAYDSYAKNFGIRSGVSANLSFSDSRSAGVALSFEQKGGVDPALNINTNLDYLTLPVFFHLKTRNDPSLFFTTGIYVSTLLNASRRGESFINGQTGIVRENATSEFRPVDFGLTAGGGIMVRLYADFDFMISAGLSAGLLNIEDIPGHRPRNYNISISAGYIYYMGYR